MCAVAVPASLCAMSGDVYGEVETEDGVLVIRRILVHHRLVAAEDARNTIEDVHRTYPIQCPLYRTLHGCIEFKLSYELIPAADVRSPAGS